MKTYTAKAGEIQHGWYVIDAQGKVWAAGGADCLAAARQT